MTEAEKIITTVRELDGLLLSDDATVFANDNGQLVQVPIVSLALDGSVIETAGDEDVDDLLEALNIPPEGGELA